MTLNSKEFVMNALNKASLKAVGKQLATDLQERSSDMTGTELYNEEEYIPTFAEAIAKKNMLDRKIGFICKARDGIIVRLLQNYDSTVYTADPTELPSLFGFVWSTDPSKAKPFIALSTSPYNKGECCSENGSVYRSKIDNNVWKPSEYSQGWKVVK